MSLLSTSLRALPVAFRQLAAGVMLSGIALSGNAVAQGFQQPHGGASNPMCQRLEAQLAMVDRNSGEAARAQQIRQYEATAGRQQGELNRMMQQAQRMGCDSSGFFSIFSGQSAQCGPVNNQIQQMRANLDNVTRNLEQLRSGFGRDRDGQRQSIILALAQNNCGQQYTAAARQQSGGGSFLEDLFGGNHRSSEPIMVPENMPRSGTYRTVCVRSCDGYYFPISFATVPSRFADDEQTCKNLCPAAQASLFTYRNPGEDMSHAVSISGAPYASSPNAFRYRQEIDPACGCRAPGQSWADALKHLDDRATMERGDIIVTEERARKMAQPPAAKGAQKGTRPADAPAASTPASPSQPAQNGNGIRTVGPTFIPKQ